jgi:hypothetical protein
LVIGFPHAGHFKILSDAIFLASSMFEVVLSILLNDNTVSNLNLFLHFSHSAAISENLAMCPDALNTGSGVMLGVSIKIAEEERGLWQQEEA